MNKLKGFTSIELLVVIAVISLLMAILMPTLHRVRSQARAVACRSNLHQWGLLFEAYSGNNDGKFFAPMNGDTWIEPMRPY
ncbi:MAG: type II secretion system protein, partial [Planctomycetota bacterium]